MTSSESSCSVCGEQVEPHTEAYCSHCGELYHLNQRTDRPGKDCGQVWINEEHMALEYGCDRCLHPEEHGAGLDDVLDIGEASAVAGLSEAALTSAADAGTLRHRRTAAGTLLFQRRDVVGYAHGGDG